LHGVEWRNNHAQFTRDGLAAAKARGAAASEVPSLMMMPVPWVALSSQAARVNRLWDSAPTIAELQAAGVTSLRAIAAALNERGIPTARGSGPWYHAQVRRLLARLEV
jgi:hypothetical protein